jgi:2-(1,2-epoxy-1,2-dihydrophenyl)acetyl-CoA isomerase
MLTNRRLGAKEALEWGLVSRVVPDAELMQEAEKLVRALAAGPTLSYGSVKRLLNGTFSQTLETQMEFEARAIVLGTPNTFLASWHAIRLSWSLPVAATASS